MRRLAASTAIAAALGIGAWGEHAAAQTSNVAGPQCSITAGCANATVSGSPGTGNLATFSGASAITGGNLSGDCTTTGGLAVACTTFNGGTAFGSAAAANTGTSGGVLGFLNGNNTHSGTNTFSGGLAVTGGATTFASGAVAPIFSGGAQIANAGVNVGAFTRSQLLAQLGSGLGNGSSAGSAFAWNYTSGSGELDLFIGQFGTDTQAMNIYEFPNGSGNPVLLLGLDNTGDLTTASGAYVSAGSGGVKTSGIIVTSAAGSQAAPSVDVGAASTGFYSPAAGELALTPNGTTSVPYCWGTAGSAIGGSVPTACTAISAAGATTYGLQLYGTTNYAGLLLSRWTANSTPAPLIFAKSRGATIGSYAAVTAGTDLGVIDFAGDDGTTLNTIAAAFKCTAEATISTGVVPAQCQVATMTAGGTLTTAVTWDDAQNETVAGDVNAVGGFKSNGTAGVTCSGTPTSSFASTLGVVTHC